jgi:hypothetical protein
MNMHWLATARSREMAVQAIHEDGGADQSSVNGG